MSFTLSHRSLTHWQRRVLVSLYFQQAGYAVNLHTGEVHTPQGTLKYRVRGTENPLKVARTLMVDVHGIETEKDLLFANTTVQHQAQWQSRMNESLTKISASKDTAVIHQAMTILSEEATVEPRSQALLERLLVAGYASPALSEIKNKAGVYRHDTQARRDVVDALVKVVDWSGLVDFSGGVSDTFAERERRVKAPAQPFYDYVLRQAQHCVDMGQPHTVLGLSLQHIAAKGGLTLVKGNQAQSRFNINDDVLSALGKIMLSVQAGDMQGAQAQLSGMAMAHDPLLSQDGQPLERSLMFANDNSPVKALVLERLLSEQLGNKDSRWVFSFVELSGQNEQRGGVRDADMEALINDIPVNTRKPQSTPQNPTIKDDMMEKKKELTRAVTFLESQRGVWSDTEIAPAMLTFINDVARFDSDAGLAWPVDTLHHAVSAHIHSRLSHLTHDDFKAVSVMASEQESWRQVAVYLPKSNQLKNVRKVDELFNVMVAVDITSLSKEAGLLVVKEPSHSVKSAPEPAQQSDEKRSATVTPLPAKDERAVATDFAALLSAAEDRIADAMWRNDELVLPDESDWFQQRWDKCVGAGDLNNQIRVAYDVFGPLMEVPSRKAIKAWYLEDVDHAVHADKLLEEAAKAKSALSHISRASALIDHHIHAISVVPGIISKAISVDAVSCATENLQRSAKKLEALDEALAKDVVDGIIAYIGGLDRAVSPHAMPWFDAQKALRLVCANGCVGPEEEALMARFTNTPVGQSFAPLPLPVDVVPPSVTDMAPVATPVSSRKRA